MQVSSMALCGSRTFRQAITDLFQRSLDLFKRQANHIAVAAFDMRDRVKSFVLDGVGAGFVKRIAAC